ncbi:MAG: metalloregulator ArsR/SmtB family transcription factor [Candidatus Nanoarchaeia archaeon]
MMETVKKLKALSDDTRLHIVEFLLDGEKCVCEIMPHVKRTASTVSIQLNKLESAGIVQSRRDGKRIYYKIRDYRVCDVFKALGYHKGKIFKKGCCMKGGTEH